MKPPWMIRRDGSCLKRSSSFISFLPFSLLFLEVGGGESWVVRKAEKSILFFCILVVQGQRGHEEEEEKRSERLVSLSFLAPDSQIAIFFSRVEGEGENPFFSSLFFLAAYGQKRVPRPGKKEGPTSKRQTASRFPYEKNNKCFFSVGWGRGECVLLPNFLPIGHAAAKTN